MVKHVIDAYYEAVLNHDGSRLASLFIPQGSMWLNVLSDDAYAHVKAKSPDTQKIRVGSYADFTKVVSTDLRIDGLGHCETRLNDSRTEIDLICLDIGNTSQCTTAFLQDPLLVFTIRNFTAAAMTMPRIWPLSTARHAGAPRRRFRFPRSQRPDSLPGE